MNDERRRTEAPGEVPGGNPEVSGGSPEARGGRWLTVSEVGQLIGMRERSARDWVKRHTLPLSDSRPLRVAEAAVREQLAREHRAPRRLPEGNGEVPGGGSEVPGGLAEPIEAAYRVAGEAAAEVALVPLATMVEELRGLADRLADVGRRNEALALEVGTLRERQVGHEAQLAARDLALGGKDEVITAQTEMIAQLRRDRERVEAERDRLAAQAAQDAPGASEGASASLRRPTSASWSASPRSSSTIVASGTSATSAAASPATR